MKIVALILGLLLASTAAFAQSATVQQPQRNAIDPRLTNEYIAALQAELALTNKIAQTIKEDAMKREKDWAEYSKPLWDFPPEEKK